MKATNFIALALLIAAGTGSVQAMEKQPQAQPGRLARLGAWFRAVPGRVKESASAFHTNASNKLNAWTPVRVKNGAKNAKNFFSLPAVYYPLTGILAAGLGYKAYQIRQDEFEWTKSAIACGLSSAVAGFAFLKQPVKELGLCLNIPGRFSR